MTLRAGVKKMINGNNRLKGRLCTHLNRNMKTIENYVKRSDEEILTMDSLAIIKDGLGLTDEQIFEPESVHA